MTFTHALTSTYKQKFRSVTTTLQTVPPTGSFTITINGRPYAIDTSYEAYRRDSFHHQSIPAQRQSINYDNIAGAGTVNTEGLWRREQTDWSLGAGQAYLDRRQDALENRFSKSKGVDPWTTWQLSLLNDVKQTNATYTKAISVGKYAYMMNGTTVAFTENWGNTPQTVGGVTGTINDICSNGTYVYVASSDGIWQIKSNTGTPTATLYVANGAMDHYEKVLDGFDGNSGTDTIRLANGFAGVYPGMLVKGTGIPSNTRVAALASNGNSITLSNTLTSNVNSGAHITFTVRKAATITNFYGVDYANNTLIAFASTSAGDNGYLFAWPTAPASIGVAPSGDDLLMDHSDPNWVWTGATGGQTQLYFSGYSSITGNANSAIYRSSIQSPGVAGIQQPYTLNYPVVALPMASNERATAIYAYLNYIFVGSNKGVRMCQTMSQYDPNAGTGGDLKAGPIVPNITQPVTQAVTSIVGSGRFVYFTWNQYDSTSTGLGRMDLTKFVQDIPLNPAYASDLMVSVPGKNITYIDWDPITNTPLISVDGSGIWTADTSQYVRTGYVESGSATYGIPDDKVAVYGSIDAILYDGSVTMQISTDNQNFFDVGGVNSLSPTSADFTVGTPRGEHFNMRVILEGADISSTPILQRFTLKSYSAVASETKISIVAQLYRINNINGQEFACNPYQEYALLDGLRRGQTLVTYVEGPLSANVLVDDLYWMPQQRQDIYTGGYQGDLLVTMKTIGGFTVAPDTTQTS